jgi:PAS domain S-box-containing protein
MASAGTAPSEKEKMMQHDTSRGVLVADDQKDFADGIAEVLEINGYDVGVAFDRESALSVVEHNGCSIALIDLCLGQTSGIELVASIKAVRPEIECLIMTAYADMDTAIQSLRKGVYDYLRKPINTDELLATLGRCCEKIKLREEKELAEAALNQKNQELIRLVAAIDQTNELVFITDKKGNFQYVNPSFEHVTGYNKDEALGKNVRILNSGRQNPDFYRNLWETISRGDAWRGKLVNRHRKGTLFTVEASITPIRDGSGRVVNYVAVTRDITKISMLESQLHQRQKMEAIGTLAGGIAHDFNNILSAIIGYTELALLDSPGGTKVAEQLNKSLNASNRAKELVGQILSFSRGEEHELMPVDMGHVVQDALKLIRASLPATIDIRRSIDVEERTILANQTQIKQVIMNVCANSQHAMNDGGGELEIRLAEAAMDKDFSLQYPELNPEDYLLLTIRDTGHGMPGGVLERIFDPYFTTKEKEEGTGLGLAIVHRIVQDHKGRIRVQSGSGNGTVFYIYFPHAFRETVVQEASVVSEKIPVGNERILVVDDEEDIVSIIRSMLTRLGYRVTTFLKSKAALTAFKEGPDRFDAIITDMTMPEMTGEMLIARIREIRPDIPVLLCSGYREMLPKGCEVRLGINGVLMKPISMVDMATTLRRALDRTLSV